MEKKRKSVAKKKGRPPKTKRLDEEESKSNSDDVTGDNCNASSSSPGYESASDEPKVLRPLTRHTLLLDNKKAALSSQSRIPVQNIDGNSSEVSTLMLVKQILFESNRVDKANHVPVEAKDTHSELESLSPDQKIVEAQNVLDLEKFTLDLLAQTPQPELPSFQVASPCSDEIMVNNNLPEIRDADNVVSILSANGTSENPMINVEGYKVKKELAPLLKAILIKYGDIARESTFSMESRSCLVELVCSIYRRLEGLKFMQLTPLELDSMLGQIEDLELVNVDVGWLHKRLDQISKVRKTYDDEYFKARGAIDIDIDMVINEKQKAVKMCEEQLQACMAAAMKLQERLQQEKDELAAAQICNGSLVHGLV